MMFAHFNGFVIDVRLLALMRRAKRLEGEDL
jgi:hypothetical protein